MSHYARIVEPMHAVCNGHGCSVPVKAPIRNVELNDFGVYFFEARFLGDWRLCSTEEDLPAFTDKGREGRAKRARRASLDATLAEMRRGRPTKSNAPSTTTITIRLTPAQREQLGDGYGPKVIAALVAQGLVKP